MNEENKMKAQVFGSKRRFQELAFIDFFLRDDGYYEVQMSLGCRAGACPLVLSVFTPAGAEGPLVKREVHTGLDAPWSDRS